MSTVKKSPIMHTPAGALDRAANGARRALVVGSIALFVCAFAGLMPVYIPALSAHALLGFAAWALLVLTVIVTATARIAFRLATLAARAARSARSAIKKACA